MLRTFAASWTPVATSVLKTMVAVGSDGSASHCSPQATPVCRCNRSARRGPAPRSDLGTAFRLQNLRGIPVLIFGPSATAMWLCPNSIRGAALSASASRSFETIICFDTSARRAISSIVSQRAVRTCFAPTPMLLFPLSRCSTSSTRLDVMRDARLISTWRLN